MYKKKVMYWYIKCVIGAAISKVMMIVVRGDYSFLRCSAYCSSGEDVLKKKVFYCLLDFNIRYECFDPSNVIIETIINNKKELLMSERQICNPLDIIVAGIQTHLVIRYATII